MRGMSEFFVLERPRLDQSTAPTDYLKADPFHVGEPPQSPRCGSFVGSRPWLPPYRVELTRWGPRFGDIVFGSGASLLVSERFARVWQQRGLVGLSGFDPVEVAKVSRRTRQGDFTPPQYRRVSVLRSRAAVDEARSGIEWEGGHAVCSECRLRGLGSVIRRLCRVVLEPEPPATEDLFYARGLGGVILASERFKALSDEQGFLNTLLIPATEFSFEYRYD